MKIKYKLILIICGILSLAIFPLSYLAIITSQKIIIENAYSLCTNLSETISNVAREELFINSTYEGSERAVSGLNKTSIKGLHRIYVINVEGVSVVDSVTVAKGKKLDETEIQYIKAIKELHYREVMEDNRTILRFTYPIFLDKGTEEYKIGAAIFDFDRDNLFYRVTEVQTNITNFSIAIVLVSILCTFIASGFFTRPIEKLKQGAIIIGSGDLNYRITKSSSDEIGQLGQSFNDMAIALQKADKMKDDFLANTTHELKTPLNGIIGLAESILDNPLDKLSEENVVNVNFIVSSGRRLLNLINDILDFSKLKNRDFGLKLTSVDLKQSADLVFFVSKSLLKDKKLKLINDIPEDLFPVEADESRLQQILYNLVGNAIKFTESGYVRLSANPTEDSIEISVQDTGIGIPEDKFDAIFQSFEQVDASISRQYGGTGLGLSITKDLIELHGSSIHVESELGKGSRFYFSLKKSEKPIEKHVHQESLTKLAAVEDVDKDRETIEEPNTIVEEGFGRILVVDDEQVNLHVLKNQLKTQKYDTKVAINGMEAIELINQGIKPDIVLLDVMMPKMNGYEVCKIIREKYSIAELPIILITAKNQISDLLEGMESGANDYISKPFSQKELLARVKTHLHVSKMSHSYAKFVPKEILQFLNKESIIDLKLGDQSLRDMTILFADIRSFTTLSEKMTPKENFNFINSYLTHIGPIIRLNNGFIDKYIGDAIMALFPSNPEDGLRASIFMQKEVVKYNQLRSKAGHLPIEIGIGLNSGTLMLGIIGEEQRMEGTVISDAVNLASRLEGLTKMYGANIAISEYVLQSLSNPEAYHYRFLDKVRVKGKKDSVGVIEVLDGLPENILELRLKTKPIYDAGQANYLQGNFSEAIKNFKEILIIDSSDKAAVLFLQRCEQYVYRDISGKWDGVVTMEDK
jgi:two-component system, sensor histidine kinase ChiS